MKQQNGILVISRNFSNTPSLFNRPPPPLPQMAQDAKSGEIFDPRKESLESFLNIRFGPNFPTINDDKNPQRDLQNFPRPVQADFNDVTRLGIIPEKWMTFFYEKTGVTGPYVFLGSFLTFLLSKEWLVFEHELLVGIQATIILVAGIKMFGPGVRNSICADIDVSFASLFTNFKSLIVFAFGRKTNKIGTTGRRA